MSALQPLVVIGAGGFGRETLDVIDTINEREPMFDLLGVLDDDPAEANLKRLADRGVPFLGASLAWLDAGVDALYAAAVGNPIARRRVVDHFDRVGRNAATLVHPAAVIGSVCSLAPGGIVCSGVQVSTNVRLARHVHLNPNATIGHDAVIEEFASINPGAIVSGECTIGAGALIGAGAVVLQQVAVAAGAVVGAAACVVHDVPEGLTVRGVPAR